MKATRKLRRHILIMQLRGISWINQLMFKNSYELFKLSNIQIKISAWFTNSGRFSILEDSLKHEDETGTNPRNIDTLVTHYNIKQLHYIKAIGTWLNLLECIF